YLYRATSPNGPFTRLTNSPTTATAYSDLAPAPGNYTYMVRTAVPVTNASGSYFDLSQGVFSNVSLAPPPVTPVLQGSTGPYGVTLTWNSKIGSSYHLERADTLAGTIWTNLSGLMEATDTNMSWTDLTAGRSQSFYRVVSP